MSRIIKAGIGPAHAQIRQITRPISLASPSAEDDALERLGAKIGALRDDLDARDHRIVELEAEIERVAVEEFCKGEVAGREAAEDKQAERLACLAKAVEAAQQDVAAELKKAESTAVLVARACLDRMLGDKAHWTALVNDLVRHQITQVSRDTLLKIEVAAEDFADDESLESLGDPVVRSNLPPGSCKMILRLGEVDAGLTQQWGTLERHLRQLAGLGGDDVR